MKHPTNHQGELEAALQTYLSTAQPLLRQQAMAEAQRYLINPSMLLQAPQLTARHALRAEALIVSDAFEAVTNGMVTSEVMDPLQLVDEDSIFAPWKHLVLAIHFFYEELDEAMLAHLRRIPDSSVLSNLARSLGSFALAQNAPKRGPAGQTRPLFAQLFVANPELSTLAQQLTDALESSAENAFWSVLTDLLEESSFHDQQLARRITLWVWNQLEWLSFDEESLLEITQALWGRAEASRLAALGSVAWDPEGAALLWARFLIHSLREDCLDGVERGVAIELLSEFYQSAVEVSEQGPDEEWTATWDSLAHSWKAELKLRGLEQVAFPASKGSKPDTHRQSSTFPPSRSGQLDLFAS